MLSSFRSIFRSLLCFPGETCTSQLSVTLMVPLKVDLADLAILNSCRLIQPLPAVIPPLFTAAPVLPVNTTVFVRGIPWEATTQTVENHFKVYGTILTCHVVRHKDASTKKGIAFVKFEEAAAAQRAVNYNSPGVMDHKEVFTEFARPKPPGGKRFLEWPQPGEPVIAGNFCPPNASPQLYLPSSSSQINPLLYSNHYLGGHPSYQLVSNRSFCNQVVAAAVPTPSQTSWTLAQGAGSSVPYGYVQGAYVLGVPTPAGFINRSWTGRGSQDFQSENEGVPSLEDSSVQSMQQHGGRTWESCHGSSSRNFAAGQWLRPGKKLSSFESDQPESRDLSSRNSLRSHEMQLFSDLNQSESTPRVERERTSLKPLSELGDERKSLHMDCEPSETGPSFVKASTAQSVQTSARRDQRQETEHSQQPSSSTDANLLENVCESSHASSFGKLRTVDDRPILDRAPLTSRGEVESSVSPPGLNGSPEGVSPDYDGDAEWPLPRAQQKVTQCCTHSGRSGFKANRNSK